MMDGGMMGMGWIAMLLGTMLLLVIVVLLVMLVVRLGNRPPK